MLQTKEELVTEFQGHMDADTSEGGNAVIRMIFEVLCDIREGLINVDKISGDDKST